MRLHISASIMLATSASGVAIGSLFCAPPAFADSNGVVAAPTATPTATAEPPQADAQTQPAADTSMGGVFRRATPVEDPTGGAYTSPTLLFIPAAAVPVWNVRVITSLDMQGPTAADRLATGTGLGFQPGLGGEVGLPAGFTLGAGTEWVGGDVSPTPISGGISPYVQLRSHLLGAADGQGFQLGTSVTYKFVGFQGDPGEMEFAFSGQYRRSRYELGLQGVIGKDFATTDADGEVHAYAIYRVIPELGLGVATQVRIGIVSQPGETTYDVIGGAIASLTLGRWQVGALGGESTVGLNQGQLGGLGEVFGTVRF